MLSLSKHGVGFFNGLLGLTALLGRLLAQFGDPLEASA